MEKEIPLSLEKLKVLLGSKEILGLVRLSRHPDDWYLWHVLYRNKDEYVCHVYNSQINGFVDGAYVRDEAAAWTIFFNRLRINHDGEAFRKSP